MKTGIILLARTGATRLPNKVLLEICGKSILEHTILRLKKVSPCDELIVATTVNRNDDAVQAIAGQVNVNAFRGSEENVLDRCIQCVEEYGLDAVIRVGSDNPLIDFAVINDMLHIFLREKSKGNDIEYLSNTFDRSFPVGLDAEIFAANTFRKIDAATMNLSEEERRLNEINVIPYLHQHRDLFNIYSYSRDFDYSNMRWTVDTPEDFRLIKNIYEALYPKKPDFTMQDVLDLLDKNPEWTEINSKVIPKSGYWTETEKNKLNKRMHTR